MAKPLSEATQGFLSFPLPAQLLYGLPDNFLGLPEIFWVARWLYWATQGYLGTVVSYMASATCWSTESLAAQPWWLFFTTAAVGCRFCWQLVVGYAGSMATNGYLQ